MDQQLTFITYLVSIAFFLMQTPIIVKKDLYKVRQDMSLFGNGSNLEKPQPHWQAMCRLRGEPLREGVPSDGLLPSAIKPCA